METQILSSVPVKIIKNQSDLKSSLRTIFLDSFNRPGEATQWLPTEAENCLDRLILLGNLRLKFTPQEELAGFSISLAAADSEIFAVSDIAKTLPQALYVAKLAVASQHRGAGYGHALVTDLIQKSEQDFSHLLVRVREDNGRMINLLSGLNFKEFRESPESRCEGSKKEWLFYQRKSG